MDRIEEAKKFADWWTNLAHEYCKAELKKKGIAFEPPLATKFYRRLVGLRNGDLRG